MVYIINSKVSNSQQPTSASQVEREEQEADGIFNAIGGILLDGLQYAANIPLRLSFYPALDTGKALLGIGDDGIGDVFNKHIDDKVNLVKDLFNFGTDVVQGVTRSAVSIGAEVIDETLERVGIDVIEDGNPLGINKGTLGAILFGNDDLYTWGDQYSIDYQLARDSGSDVVRSHLFASGSFALSALDITIVGGLLSKPFRAGARQARVVPIQKKFNDAVITDAVFNTRTQFVSNILDDIAISKNKGEIRDLLSEPEIISFLSIKQIDDLADELVNIDNPQQALNRIRKEGVNFILDNSNGQVARTVAERGAIKQVVPKKQPKIVPRDQFDEDLALREAAKNSEDVKIYSDRFITASASVPKDFKNIALQASRYDDYDSFKSSVVNKTGSIENYLTRMAAYRTRFDRSVREAALNLSRILDEESAPVRELRGLAERNKVALSNGNNSYNALAVAELIKLASGKGFKSEVSRARGRIDPLTQQLRKLDERIIAEKERILAVRRAGQNPSEETFLRLQKERAQVRKELTADIHLIGLSKMVDDGLLDRPYIKELNLRSSSGNKLREGLEQSVKDGDEVANVMMKQFQDLLSERNPDRVRIANRVALSAYKNKMLDWRTNFNSLPGVTQEDKLMHIFKQAQEAKVRMRQGGLDGGNKTLTTVYERGNVAKALKMPFNFIDNKIQDITRFAPGATQENYLAYKAAFDEMGLAVKQRLSNKNAVLERVIKRYIQGSDKLTPQQIRDLAVPMNNMYLVSGKKGFKTDEAQKAYRVVVNTVDDIIIKSNPGLKRKEIRASRNDISSYFVMGRLDDYYAAVRNVAEREGDIRLKDELAPRIDYKGKKYQLNEDRTFSEIGRDGKAIRDKVDDAKDDLVKANDEIRNLEREKKALRLSKLRDRDFKKIDNKIERVDNKISAQKEKVTSLKELIATRSVDVLTDEIIQRFGTSNIEKIETIIREYNQETARLAYEGGMITSSELERFVNDPSYVPFERLMDEVIGEGDIFQNISVAREGAVLTGSSAGLTTLRGSKRTVANVFDSSLGRRQQMISKVEDNEYRQQLGRSFDTFVEGKDILDDGDDVIAREVVSSIEKITDQGKIAKLKKSKERDRLFTYKVDGEDVAYLMNKNLIQTFNSTIPGLGADGAAKIAFGLFTMAAYGTRYIKNLHTTYKISFAPVAFIRDLSEMFANATAMTGMRSAFGTVEELTSVKDIVSYHTGKRLDTDGVKQYKEFLEGGGATGFVQSGIGKTKTTDEFVFKSFKQLADAKDKRASNIKGRVENFAENYNRVFENWVRYSYYKRLLKEGYTKETALKGGKEITVNFDRKGSLNPYINSLFAFYNATIRGYERQLMTFSSGKGLLTIGATHAAMSNFVNTHNNMIDPEWKDKLSDWNKDNYYNFLTNDGKAFRLPVAHAHLGVKKLFDLSNDYMEGRIGIEQAIKESVSQNIGSYNPTGGRDVLSSLSPTAIDPVSDVLRNESFFGEKIAPGGKAANAPTSIFQWQNDDEALRLYSQGLQLPIINNVAEFAGITPAKLRYLEEQYFAGALRDVADFTEGTIRGKATKDPFTSRFEVELYSGQQAKRNQSNAKYEKFVTEIKRYNRANPNDSQKIYGAFVDFFNTLDEDEIPTYRYKAHTDGFDVTGISEKPEAPQLDIDRDSGEITAPDYFGIYWYYRKKGADHYQAAQAARYLDDRFTEEKELLEEYYDQ